MYLSIASSSDVKDFRSSSTRVSSDVSVKNLSIVFFHLGLQSLPIHSSVDMDISWFLNLPDGGDVKFCIHCMVVIFGNARDNMGVIYYGWVIYQK